MTPAEPAGGRGRQLLAARMENTFGASGRAYVTAWVVMVGSFVQGAIVWGSASHARILLWVALVVTCQVGSMLLIAAYRRAAPEPAALPRWGVYKVMQTTALGLAWGLGVVLLYRPGETATLLVPAMSVVCVAVASTITNASYPPGMYPLLLGCILPGAVVLLADPRGGVSERNVGLALLTLQMVVLTGGVVMARLIRESMLTRLDLADALGQERKLREETERARGEAEAARLRTTRFFSAASHDLRQPVHALALYVSLLRKDPSDAERRPLLDGIASCVDGLEELFGAILGVAQTETARSQSVSEPLPLERIFKQVAVKYAHGAESKGLRLRVAPTSLWVGADPIALARIVGNLVDNAIAYTHAGTVLIGARRGAGACRVVVADSGIGIAAAEQEKIFDDFYQVGNAERDRSKGFGLGLPTVQRLCKALGYQVALRSTLGKGSAFSVTLPRAQPVVEPAGGSVAEPGGAGDLRVLLVEDDPLVQDAMRRLLLSWGTKLVVCEDGEGALAALRGGAGQRWQVLLDFRLPGSEDGLGIASRIRQHIHPCPAMALLTGEEDAAVLEAAAAQGLVVLRKPVKPLRLRAVLEASRALGA